MAQKLRHSHNKPQPFDREKEFLSDTQQEGGWSKMPSSSLHFGMHHMVREAPFT
jgi:hypothetical protein